MNRQLVFKHLVNRSHRTQWEIWLRKNWWKIISTILMIAFAVTMILPFLWMLSTSLKKPIDVFNFPIEWIPSSFEWGNYHEVMFGRRSFWLYYWNSIKVTGSVVIGTVILSSAAAYGFSRIQFKGRDAVFVLYLATMMVPEQVLLVPRFVLFDWIGIYNTHWAVILPSIFLPIGTFLLRQFYMSIPNDFSEAARIEGANHFQIWTRIIFPLSKPATMSLVILCFTLNWNEFLNPLVFLPSEELFTVPLGLTTFKDDTGTDYTLMMAASVCAILPVIVLFLVCQRWFIEGVMASGVKG